MFHFLLSLILLINPDPVSKPQASEVQDQKPVLMELFYDQSYPIHVNDWLPIWIDLRNLSDEPVDILRMQLDICCYGVYCRFESSPAIWCVVRYGSAYGSHYVLCDGEIMWWALSWMNDPVHLEPAGENWDVTGVGYLYIRAPNTPGDYEITLRRDDFYYPVNGTWLHDAYTGEDILEAICPETTVLHVVP